MEQKYFLIPRTWHTNVSTVALEIWNIFTSKMYNFFFVLINTSIIPSLPILLRWQGCAQFFSIYSNFWLLNAKSSTPLRRFRVILSSVLKNVKCYSQIIYKICYCHLVNVYSAIIIVPLRFPFKHINVTLRHRAVTSHWELYRPFSCLHDLYS